MGRAALRGMCPSAPGRRATLPGRACLPRLPATHLTARNVRDAAGRAEELLALSVRSPSTQIIWTVLHEFVRDSASGLLAAVRFPLVTLSVRPTVLGNR